MASEKRTTFMDKLLGRGQSKEVRSKLRGIQDDLDAAGLERKNKKALTTKALQTKLKQLNLKAEDVAEVAEALTDVIVQELGAAGIIDAAIESGAVAAEDELGVQEIIMDAVTTAAETVMVAPVEDAVEVEMADAGVGDDLAEEVGTASGDAGDEDKLASREIRRSLKTLTTHISEQSEDMGELVQTMVSLAKSLKTANETNALLEGRLTKLEKQLAGRPRQASKAVETEFEAPPKVKAEIEKGLDGEREMLFGHIPLKPVEK